MADSTPRAPTPAASKRRRSSDDATTTPEQQPKRARTSSRAPQDATFVVPQRSSSQSIATNTRSKSPTRSDQEQHRSLSRQFQENITASSQIAAASIQAGPLEVQFKCSEDQATNIFDRLNERYTRANTIKTLDGHRQQIIEALVAASADDQPTGLFWGHLGVARMPFDDIRWLGNQVRWASTDTPEEPPEFWGYGSIPSSTPSKTRVSLASNTLALQAVHYPDFVELLAAYYSTDESRWNVAPEELWKWLTRSDHMFANRKEGSITAMLSAWLSQMCCHDQALWVHQLPLESWGIPDVCLLHRESAGTLVVIEAAKEEGTPTKAEQLYSYIGKLFQYAANGVANMASSSASSPPLSSWPLPMLGIQLFCRSATSIELVISGYSQMYCLTKTGVTLLVHETISRPHQLVGLLRLLDCWQSLCIERLRKRDFLMSKERQRFFSRKISLVDGTVRKQFDYRYRYDDFLWRRDARQNERIPGARLTVLVEADEAADPPTLAFVQYPFSPSTTNPTIGHLADVLNQLGELHEENVCHGDIRRSNMVLCDHQSWSSSTSTSSSNVKPHLIDFDMAGKPGERLYPPLYNHEIDDSKRHDDAVMGAPLHKSHDRFSMAWIMRHSVVEASAEWLGICDRVETGDVEVSFDSEESFITQTTNDNNDEDDDDGWQRLDETQFLQAISRVNSLRGIARVIQSRGLSSQPLQQWNVINDAISGGTGSPQ